MKQDFANDLTPEVREKMKKNTVYISVFSIAMIFAGLTSAYIVSMGDSFWVKYNFPPAFYISTAFILLSSLVFIIGVKKARKENKPGLLKIIVPTTFVFGVLFAVFQWIGYGQLVENGAYLSSKITVSNGRYGNYYELKVNNQYMEVDGNDYLVGGKLMGEKEKQAISSFADQLTAVSTAKAINISNYGKYIIYKKDSPVTLKNGQFFVNDSIPLQYVDLVRLEEFAVHLRDGRGHFFHKGKYGKDFIIYYNGKALDYKGGQLMYNGLKLSAPLQLKMDDSADQSSSYIYIITFLHLLHILGTLIFMLIMSIRSFSGRLATNDYIQLRVGGIFWHFLGGLWIYLLLFLLFIH
jgi:cytochrome c oxidase subunit 3